MQLTANNTAQAAEQIAHTTAMCAQLIGIAQSAIHPPGGGFPNPVQMGAAAGALVVLQEQMANLVVATAWHKAIVDAHAQHGDNATTQMVSAKLLIQMEGHRLAMAMYPADNAAGAAFGEEILDGFEGAINEYQKLHALEQDVENGTAMSFIDQLFGDGDHIIVITTPMDADEAGLDGGDMPLPHGLYTGLQRNGGVPADAPMG